MSDRHAPASSQFQGPATAYPDIPRQWSGRIHESIPSDLPGPPPAGLDAPMPIPRTHPIRNTALGIAAFLMMTVLIGGLVPYLGPSVSTSPSSTTIGVWQDHGGLDHVKALLNDLEAAREAGKADDVAGMDMACRSLHSDAESAEAYTPIPDAEAQTHWAATLAHLTHASATCVTAIRNRDADLFTRASGEMAAVSTDVSAVVDRLLALNR